MPFGDDSERALRLSGEVQQHEPALRSYLQGRFPQVRDIDDLVQETYARFFRICRTITIDQPKAYLFRTARNIVFDLYRRKGLDLKEGLGTNELESVIEESRNPAESAINDYDLEMLTEAIAALPERCRIVLQLCRFQGLSYREIAKSLGITESTVSAQLAIALVRCRRHFRARGALEGNRHVGEP